MRIGVTFPQIEFGNDPAAIRDYAQAIEDLGYAHFLVYDHVLGAHPDRFKDLYEGKFRPPYDYRSTFHEPFVLFGYFAALTTRIELATGIANLQRASRVDGTLTRLCGDVGALAYIGEFVGHPAPKPHTELTSARASRARSGV